MSITGLLIMTCNRVVYFTHCFWCNTTTGNSNFVPQVLYCSSLSGEHMCKTTHEIQVDYVDCRHSCNGVSRCARFPLLTPQNPMKTGFTGTSLTTALPHRLPRRLCDYLNTSIVSRTARSSTASFVHILPYSISLELNHSTLQLLGVVVVAMVFQIISPTSLHLIHILRFPVPLKNPLTVRCSNVSCGSAILFYARQFYLAEGASTKRRKFAI